jgi:hypothetical protein
MESLADRTTVSELCRSFGFSRKEEKPGCPRSICFSVRSESHATAVAILSQIPARRLSSGCSTSRVGSPALPGPFATSQLLGQETRETVPGMGLQARRRLFSVDLRTVVTQCSY